MVCHASRLAMNRSDRQRLPIGYWLKRADELLTARIDEAQRENGLTRLGWQALNVVRDAGGAEPSHVAETLAPFASAAEVTGVLAALTQRGLIVETEGRLRLSASGVETYERALASQKAIRERAFAGIEPSEYETTMAVLRRLVENLEGGAGPAAAGQSGA